MLCPRLILFVGLAAAASLPAQVRAIPPVEERQFDFWVGEWDVQNRSLGKDAGWHDAGKSRARIRPILGGRAILEEWDGRSGQRENTFGISVRYLNAEAKRWVIILSWPNANQAGFSNMEGLFRHGRAEFFPPSTFDGKPLRAERFTFSDALPNSCRWDMAAPVDGGGWRTSWIMEFTRAQSSANTISAGEPIHQPPKECVCKAEEARQFDGLVGEWEGRGSVTVGDKQRVVFVKLRASSTNRGCATLCFLDVDGVDYREKHFEAWAWNKGAKKWVGRALNEQKPSEQVLVGTFDAQGAASMVRTDRLGVVLEKTRRVRYEPKDGGWQVVHETSSDAGKTWAVHMQVVLTAKR